MSQSIIWTSPQVGLRQLDSAGLLLAGAIHFAETSFKQAILTRFGRYQFPLHHSTVMPTTRKHVLIVVGEPDVHHVGPMASKYSPWGSAV
eukprot:CAMPEP_0175154100 /NCGR_PEP_ID=MMETSP0087-20121206/20134_1 /TAXON_ID=136419 /ORGANISM="Unknown Unknown, Strain D1" /LENGTH=89 /DNA_ID=CAMNT_0016440911 /DNA_START=68 /DNA_END=337 /DNA_ORIENTATION=+